MQCKHNIRDEILKLYTPHANIELICRQDKPPAGTDGWHSPDSVSVAGDSDDAPEADGPDKRNLHDTTGSDVVDTSACSGPTAPKARSARHQQRWWCSLQETSPRDIESGRLGHLFRLQLLGGQKQQLFHGVSLVVV